MNNRTLKGAVCVKFLDIKEKRIYYLVYDDLQAVLIVAVGGKNEQQETIDHVISSLDAYKFYLKKKLGL